jgi:antitoxin component YwqK of YwqJK toxin-antitoxin module
MSWIKNSDLRGKHWIKDNHPQDGLFRVYWKDVDHGRMGGVTFDPDEGEGLRYEWNYVSGKKHGKSKGWWPNGQIKSIRYWVYGIRDGNWTEWFPSGQTHNKRSYKDGIGIGVWNFWYRNGQMKRKRIFQDGDCISDIRYNLYPEEDMNLI